MAKKHKQGRPIIEQSPTVKAGGQVFVILPSQVVTVREKRKRG